MLYGILGAVILLLGVWTWRKPRQASVIVWALTSTLCVSAAALKVLPGSFAENVVWYAAFVALAWATVQVWVYWEPRVWRVAGSLIGATVISGIVIVLVPSPV